MVIVVVLNRKEFRVFVLLVYNLSLFFAVIRPVVGPPLSRKKTDPVSRFEIHWVLIISTKLFISLKIKNDHIVIVHVFHYQVSPV